MIRPYFAIGRKPRKRISKGKKALLMALIVVVLFSWLIFTIADRAILPPVTAIAEQRLVSVINEEIDISLVGIIEDFGLTSEDFYTLTTDGNLRLTSLSVNTILVNHVASSLAANLSRRLSTEEAMAIGVPVGLFTGIPIFAGLGPDFAVNVIPTGEAVVEYETSFSSAGINQINFQVWLTVETSMRIVIPLQETTVSVSRRVPLVNTVFAGEVPEGMILTDIGFVQ